MRKFSDKKVKKSKSKDSDRTPSKFKAKFKSEDSDSAPSNFRDWHSSKPSGRRNSSKFRRKAEWPNNSSHRRRDGPVEMYKAICDNCGAKCEVPFKPTPGKPVLCSDCFRKKSNKKDDLTIVNGKLDKIMKALNIE